MDNGSVNFITQASEQFSKPLLTSAKMIRSLYPNQDFYIYDGGLADRTVSKLDEFDNTKVIDWTNEAHYEVSLSEQTRLVIEDSIHNNTYLRHLVEQVIEYKPIARMKRRDFYVRQKPLCILDCTNRVDGNLFWIDSDAVLINSISELFEEEYDVAGTLRSRIETELGYEKQEHPVLEINNGVIHFNTTADKIRLFVQNWLEEIESFGLVSSREQTAFSNLIQESNDNMFNEYYNEGMLELGDNIITTKILPCDIYNHINPEKGINPNRQKIIHFKAGKYEEKVFDDLLETIKTDDFAKWTRWPTD